MSRLQEALVGITRIGIDTSPFIYLLEAHPLYLPLAAPLFDRIELGELDATTSTITVAEVMVLPLRLRRYDLHQQYLDFLLNTTSLDVLPVNFQVAQTAAELRAQYNVRLPDALQLAAAIIAKCDAFVTNDRALRQVTAIPVFVLDDFLERGE